MVNISESLENMTVNNGRQEVNRISGDEQNLLDVLNNMIKYFETKCTSSNCFECTATNIVKIGGLLMPNFDKIIANGNINSAFLELFQEKYEEFYRVSSTAGNF